MLDNEWSLESSSEEETRDLAARLAELVEEGDVILLAGPLGAGKTVFVQGLARSLGIRERIISPTFTIVREYGAREGARLPLFHVDLSRLEADDFRELGYEEESAAGVMVVEWGEKLRDDLGDWMLVRLEHGLRSGQRRLEVAWKGPRGAALAEAWAHEVARSR